MENNFPSLISSAQSILILLPTRPYFDQVAAGLALYLSLKEEKETSIVCPSPMLVEFNRLVGVNKITTELSNKNLVIKFGSYPAENVERVSANVEAGKFFLTVIPKPGFFSPKKEEVELSYSGVAADTVILVGGTNKSHFPFLTTPDAQGIKTIHLGIRAFVDPDGGNLISLARPASSVSELIAGLIKESGLTLDADIATNLVLGIEEGSRRFTGEEVTAETFELFAQLLRAGGQRFVKEPTQKAFYPQSLTETPVLSKPISKPEENKEKEKAPPDWLEPKIYKGTSIS